MLLRLQNSFNAMDAMARRQERIANNLANANTVGYKRDRSFTEAVNERLDAEAAPRSDRAQTQWIDPAQGAFEATGNPLDVAINGEGFFALTDENADRDLYTRAGRFMVGEDGTLRDPRGYAVQGEGGPIQIPPEGEAIEISQRGEIRAGNQILGRLRLVRFDEPERLRRLDGASFTAPDDVEPLDVETPAVLQGHLEGSNVNVIHEMNDMISNFRLFESHQRALRTADQLLGRVSQELGRF